MAADLKLLPQAEQDVSDAYDWYESQRFGLGEEFLTCIESCLEQIRRWPELPGRFFEDFRRVLVRRFPYVVFYEFREGTVIVHAVFHAARDPSKWRRRLS